MPQFLPNELLQEIFKNDSQNIKFLHSCLLVNKSWSVNVIPILYNPSVQEWCTLNLHGNDPSALQIPQKIFLFFANFSSGLETLDFEFEIECLYKLGVSLELTNLMNANTFNVILSQDTKVSEWVSNVKNIFLNGAIVGRYDFSMVLYACHNIKTLKVRFPYYGSDHYFSTLNKICQFIELQQNLESFTLYKSEFHSKIGNALNKHKCSLRHIEFFETEIIRSSPLEWILNCEKLESLAFIDTAVLPWLFAIKQPNYANLKKLKCLIIKVYFRIPSDFIINLIQSSNLKLQVVEFDLLGDQQYVHPFILEKMSYHCSNLTKLGVKIDAENIPTLLNLIKNCRKLEILEIYGNDKQLDVNDILPELGLSLSHELVELIIGANWSFTHDGLLNFLKNSQHTTLYKVVFMYLDFINDDYLKVIAENSMKSLKYITFKDVTLANTEVGIGNASIWLKTSSMKCY
ncbi:hypothetical protein C1646_777822 [Rhizophagus diaphanus]|nr:hypothetical protein C1646_777822 [Rhizophagus diaphanus] [Rhizophagus sp. MUCL 43196]